MVSGENYYLKDTTCTCNRVFSNLLLCYTTSEIYYLEFLASTLEVQGRITEERLAEAFDRIDSDDTGYITRRNLSEMLGSDFSKEKVDNFIATADADGDDKISFEEFMEFFHADREKQVKELRPDYGMSSSSLASSQGDDQSESL